MLITDYTITHTSPTRALISWDGGSSSYYWTCIIDGQIVFSVSGNGLLEQSVPLSEEGNHSIVLVRHNESTDYIGLIEPRPLNNPTLRWLSVPNAAYYEVYRIIGDDEYVVHTEHALDDLIEVFSWQLPTVYAMGFTTLRIKVLAYGSFGSSETPSVIAGPVVGLPKHVKSVSAELGSSGNRELLLSLD